MNNAPLFQKVLDSLFFKIATKQASRYINNAGGTLKLLKLTLEKLTQGKSASSITPAISEKFQLIVRMVKAYITGQYKIIPASSLLKILASLVYFISPVDFIPDFLPVIGLTDDIALLLWVFQSLDDDIQNFKLWEDGKLGV